MTRRSFLDDRQTHHLRLPPWGAMAETWHVFERTAKLAVNAALASDRPLLVRGEPGTGKSQLARAAAADLGRVLIVRTIDGRTEARDLFWTFDAVARLARAHMLGGSGVAREDAERELDERGFLKPGPLWWAFDWQGATEQAKRAGAIGPSVTVGAHVENGVVLLLDEIDKANSSVPNGLLEALGSGRFEAPGFGAGVSRLSSIPPLVIVTTNEERALPDAFLRRCVVLHLSLPKERGALVDWLIERGRVHDETTTDTVRRRAAELLVEDRERARKLSLSPPGQAEYLDLLRVLLEQRPGDEKGQLDLLEMASRFVLRKHPELESS